jgi:hypothetical protein
VRITEVSDGAWLYYATLRGGSRVGIFDRRGS